MIDGDYYSPIHMPVLDLPTHHRLEASRRSLEHNSIVSFTHYILLISTVTLCTFTTVIATCIFSKL
jgi:hypothetical protein